MICQGPAGWPIEQYVPAGSRCAQGIISQKLDAIEYTVATTTHAFDQFGANDQPMATLSTGPVSGSATASATSTAPATCPTAKIASPKCVLKDDCMYPNGAPDVITYLCDTDYCGRTNLSSDESSKCAACCV